MDQALLRTFLEVARTRHFGRAAEALCITQSAVSARIKQLESSLGVDLFTRRRNDIQLTPAGQRLHWHAELMTRAWERARVEVVQDGRSARVLAVGCTPDLWAVLVKDWVARLDLGRRGLGLHVELLSAVDLSQRLRAGLLDLAFTFESAGDPDLELERIGSVELELVAARPALSVEEALEKGYIQVDWGSAFTLAHASAFPGTSAPAIRASHGLVARDLLERLGGSAYLPRALAEPAVSQGRLFYVEGAPVYHRRLYVAYRSGGLAAELIQQTLLKRHEEAV